jgi:hypothetical protein
LTTAFTQILKARALANKQYISIIRLFDLCGITTGDDYNPVRARKQLQAEFGIAQDGFIEAGGFAYTRQDVFEEIEHPDFEKRMVFHRQIWERSQLLELLEQNSVNVYTISEEFEPFWGNAEFDAFFSPFFAGPFQYVSRALLTEHKLRNMGEWLKYEGFLQPAEREEALRPLRIYLDENERLLRNVKGENFKIMRPKISHWFSSSWHQMFNNLPHEFYDIKIDIVVLLINLTVAIQKSHKSDCGLLSDQLISVTDIEEHLRSTIISNHQAYSSRSGSFSNFGKGTWWVVWLFIMLLRGVATCNDSSNNDRFRTIDRTEFSLPTDTSIERNIRVSPDTSVGKTPSKERMTGGRLDSILQSIDRDNSKTYR